ncbi:thiamine diphosphokinase [Lactobacillus sp. PV034]|uniref:thiamine diphosphokinase n=1 Tax=Lactobacillus sp. PV034 TaxID=2594495 RepID=UPI0022406F35|nr:thiamine diphosphokinase [Lactobacillus sp. PV034]QNQ80275.1 thiamine diphosphokinase [Lactobacillus sp. PV034]
MRAVAVLGGPIANWPIDIKEKIKKAQASGAVVAASDRGSLFLLELGIIPDLAVGDFDSLRKVELDKIEEKVKDIRYAKPEKDETDSELLFLTLFEDYQIEQVELYGATGGRLDHFFVNLFTFLNAPLNKYMGQVRIIDQQNLILFLKPGTNSLQPLASYNYLGVGNLTPVRNLNIEGAKYPLKQFSSHSPRMFSSNEFIKQNQIKVTFDEGDVIAIYSRDQERFSNI